jgi:hypothetical protein
MPRQYRAFVAQLQITRSGDIVMVDARGRRFYLGRHCDNPRGQLRSQFGYVTPLLMQALVARWRGLVNHWFDFMHDES